MAILRHHDVFVKARADIKTKSSAGGLVSVVATSAALLLLLCQVYTYVFPQSTQHTLHLNESRQLHMLATDKPLGHADPVQQQRKNRDTTIPLYLKITFVHVSCENFDVKLNSQIVEGDDFGMWTTPISNNKNKNKKKPVKKTIQKFKPKEKEYKNGCTIVGNMRVPLVSGSLSLTLTKQAWSEALNYFMSRAHMMSSLSDRHPENERQQNAYNMTHYIHEIRFGAKGGLGLTTSGKGFADTSGLFENKLHVIENEMNGIALEQIQIKLIPTIHHNPGVVATLFGQGQRPFYQMSVVEHTIEPETMVSGGGSSGSLPGIGLSYDITPLAVHINENSGESGFFSFVSTLIGIVGGCFVTMSLFASCAVSSVQAVAKKMD